MLGGVASADELILRCGISPPYTYDYIHLDKKKAGIAYLQKNKKDIFIYDWTYEDVSISENEIEYLVTISFWLGYEPKIKRYNKIIIDRNSGNMYFYYKDPHKIFSMRIPDFLNKIIDSYSYAWIFQTWQESSTISKCEKANMLDFNLIFKTKADYEIEKKINNPTPQKKF